VRVALAGLVAVSGLIAACDGGGVVSNPYQCIGLPTATCERMLAEARQQMPGVAVVGAVIRCTIPVCTEARGEASLRVDFANGRYVEFGNGWEQSEPVPGRPVPEPVPVDPAPDPVEPPGPSTPARS
jgi:hypothetical protein